MKVDASPALVVRDTMPLMRLGSWSMSSTVFSRVRSLARSVMGHEILGADDEIKT